MPTTSSTALLLFFITISAFQFLPKGDDTSTVRVKYSRDSIRRTERQPLTLKCTAEYEEEPCGNIWVSWCLTVPAKQCETLTDSDRYVIHINETKSNGRRQQDAFITFTQLTLSDSGSYQCEAKCQRSQTSAMGHVISVTVTGDSNNVQEIPDRSNRCSVNVLLTIGVFILFWIH